MQQISEAQLNEIASAGNVLARDDGFLRAVRATDGRIWKQFRRKSLPSTAALWPYAKRFIRASRLLQQRGINTVTVRDIYKVTETGRHVVVYDELPGRSLRTALETDGVQKLADFARYMAVLHERGIYFRSMHMDNVLVLDAGDFALIDVTHVTFHRQALNPWRRVRNFKPITSYAEDRAMLKQYGIRQFLEKYCVHAGLRDAAQQKFLSHLQRLNEHFANAAAELQRGQAGENVAAVT